MDGLVLCLDAGNTKSYPGSGTTWSDLISGNGNNGTLTNGPTFDSISGGSIVFDGTNDYVSLSNVQPGTNDFTISVWVYKNNNTSNDYVWDFGANGGTLSAGTDILGYGFRYYNATLGTSSNMYTQGTIPNVSEWYEVTITRNSGTSTMYVNGQSITSSSGDTHNISSTTLYIGRYGGGTGYEHDGRISNFKIYNRALSASEVKQNYNAIKSRFVSAPTPSIVTSGLVLHLDAGNSSSYPGSGTTWSDLIGNNNATLVNGPTYSSSNSGSIVFDGTNDYSTIADVTGVTDFSISNNYTVDFWVYLNTLQSDTTSADNDVVEKWSASGGYPYVFRYLRSTQEMQVAAYNGSSSNSTTIQISSNVWWHICGVFDWTNSTLTFYGNSGSSVSSTATLNLSGTITNTSALNLMRRGNGFNYTTGNLSTLKIYNRALSASEVTQNFNALRGRFGI